MFCMQIRLVAVRAREFAVRILRGNRGALGSAVGAVRGSRTSRHTGKDTSPALGSNNLSPGWLFTSISRHAIWRNHTFRSRPHRRFAFWVTERPGRHRREIRTAITWWCRRNRLWIGLRARSRWQEGVRRLKLLLLLSLVLLTMGKE